MIGMFEKLLPIGSVVTLKGGLKKLMIVGLKVAVEEAPDTFYDYIGVLYPEGFMGAQSHFLFNHDDINDVIFMGYSNPERESFIKYMDEEYKKQQQENS